MIAEWAKRCAPPAACSTSAAAASKARAKSGASDADDEEEREEGDDTWKVNCILATRVLKRVRQWQVSWMPSSGKTFKPTWETKGCFVGDDGTSTEQFLEFEAKRLQGGATGTTNSLPKPPMYAQSTRPKKMLVAQKEAQKMLLDSDAEEEDDDDDGDAAAAADDDEVVKQAPSASTRTHRVAAAASASAAATAALSAAASCAAAVVEGSLAGHGKGGPGSDGSDAGASADITNVKKEKGMRGASSAEAMVLSESSDLDDDVMAVDPPGVAAAAAAAKRKGNAKGKARAANYDSSDLDDNNDGGGGAENGAFRAVSDGEDSDDDLAVVGVKGQFALRDFPHTREHCVAKKATFGTEDHCANCYCMVCDCVVAKCSDWKSHCKATFSDPRWRAARNAAKNGGTSGGGGGGGAASGASAGRGHISSGNGSGSTKYNTGAAYLDGYRPGQKAQRYRKTEDDVPFNCGTLLESIQQVYPEEAQKPTGLVVSALRHYQKQSIAFMLANEQATAVAGQPANPCIGDERRAPKLSYAGHIRVESPWAHHWIPCVKGDGKIRGGWLCDEVGMGKTMCCIATILANPCIDASTEADFDAVKEWLAKEKVLAAAANVAVRAETKANSKESNFNRYKKQLLTMQEMKNRANKGWSYTLYKNVLDDAKTPAFEALQADASKATVARANAEAKYYTELQALGPRPTTKLKATVVVVPPTLLGQWVDEFKKYAPSLTVYSLHSGTGGAAFTSFKKSAALARKADVLIVSKYLNASVDVGGDSYFGPGHCIGGDPMTWFHRVIVDEVHIGNTRSKWCMAPLRWGVTGTPASKSPSDLAHAAEWLGQPYEAAHLKAHSRSPNVHKETMALHVAKLKTLMIRHTKDMQIGGTNALVLPILQSKAVMLDMSAAERRQYDRSRQLDLSKSRIQTIREAGGTMMYLEMNLKATRDAAAGLDSKGTKMKALKQALVDLKASEPHFQVIIFTRSVAAHGDIVQMANALGVGTYQLTAKVSMAQRHASIREFQTPATCPRVCIASVNIGSVGVTLTAATRVYLMEPSIDPAAEVQCAGRIHRLGQTKDVLFTRFCFRNTIDEAIVKLHEKFAKNELTIDDDRKLSSEGVKLITSM